MNLYNLIKENKYFSLKNNEKWRKAKRKRERKRNK